jgi:hypothetical protein
MKRVSAILTLFSLLAALVSIAAAPSAAGTATLIGAGYVEGKGVVFTFHITGNVSRSDLRGSVSVDGAGNYGLDCVRVDSETVKCTAPKAVAGHNVVVTWGGSTFWTYVPPIPEPKSYCYSIYDWDAEPTTEWVHYGTYCQDVPAAYDTDIIIWENPDWGLSIYQFLPESPDQEDCLGKRHGDAYYFPWCGTGEHEEE